MYLRGGSAISANVHGGKIDIKAGSVAGEGSVGGAMELAGGDASKGHGGQIKIVSGSGMLGSGKVSIGSEDTTLSDVGIGGQGSGGVSISTGSVENENAEPENYPSSGKLTLRTGSGSGYSIAGGIEVAPGTS